MYKLTARWMIVVAATLLAGTASAAMPDMVLQAAEGCCELIQACCGGDGDCC